LKIGRDFTNLLNASFLTDEERDFLLKGKLLVSDMDAKIQIQAKADVINQIRVAKKIGLEHIELDGGIPNPFLDMTERDFENIKNFANENNITLSFHIPYTFVATATASFQEKDRRLAVMLIKKYIEVAENLGCININMHPGAVPFYQTEGKYYEMIMRNVTASLLELVPYAEEKGILFHLENNTAFDGIIYEIDDCLAIIKALKSEGHNIKFCFDIGHWFTRKDIGLEIPEPPENIVDTIPEEFLSGAQVHLNDYIPVIKKFHPPLHYQSGLLKRENLLRLLKKFKEKKVAIVILETAVREINELLNAEKIMSDEQSYLKSIFQEIENQ